MPQLYHTQQPYQYNHELGPIFILSRSIHLRRLYTSGDKVAGFVRVKKLTEATSIIISFKGRTCCNKEDNTILFSFTTPLYSGPGRILANSDRSYVDLPFEFHFPETVELPPNNINDAEFKPSEMFEHRPGFLLPPAMYAKRGIARVEYYLEAHMPSDQMFFSGKTRVVQQLRFSPSVVVHNWIPPPLLPCSYVSVRRQTRLLDSTRAEEQRSRLARLKDTIHRDDAPSATFSITVTLPGEVRVGEPVRMSILLVHRERSEEVAEPPVITLREIIGRRILHVHARVPSLGAHEGAHRATSTEELNIFSSKFDLPGLVVVAGMTFDDLTPALELDRAVPPDFRSYGVSATHDLKIILVLECAGKVSEAEFVRERVMFLPMRKDEANSAEPMDLPEYEAEEQPPPYEAPPYEA